jgi:hypothetical protein
MSACQALPLSSSSMFVRPAHSARCIASSVGVFGRHQTLYCLPWRLTRGCWGTQAPQARVVQRLAGLALSAVVGIGVPRSIHGARAVAGALPRSKKVGVGWAAAEQALWAGLSSSAQVLPPVFLALVTQHPAPCGQSHPPLCSLPAGPAYGCSSNTSSPQCVRGPAIMIGRPDPAAGE